MVGSIKVYFGPFRHSPAPELPCAERQLWLIDFHLLRGHDADFWTNNPLILDMFRATQVYVWLDERWTCLTAAMADLAQALPEQERVRLVSLPPGKLALAVEMIWRLRAVENQDGE